MATRTVSTTISVCDFCHEDIEFDFILVVGDDTRLFYMTKDEGNSAAMDLTYDERFHPSCFIKHLTKELEIV